MGTKFYGRNGLVKDTGIRECTKKKELKTYAKDYI